MPEILTRVFSCEFYEISKNTFFYRTPLMAASEVALNHFLVMRNGYRSSVFIITFMLQQLIYLAGITF